MGKLKIIIVLLVMVAVGAAAGIIYLNFNKKVLPEDVSDNEIINTEESDNMVGSDRDEHGCIGSAGYSWCEPKNKCLRIWEESCFVNEEEEIRSLLAEKYDKSLNDVQVRVVSKDQDFMVGTVFFNQPGLPTPATGGMFLAVNQGNGWELVYDGNGSVDCEKLKDSLHFPPQMLVGFCDE